MYETYGCKCYILAVKSSLADACCQQDVQPLASLLDGALFIWPALDKKKNTSPVTAETK